MFFDSAVTIRPDGSDTVNLLGLAGGATNFSGATILGNSLSVNLLASLLPSQGRAFADDGWNLWPRNGASSDTQISDFAPHASTPRVDRISEPETLPLLAFGGLAAFGIARRRKTA